MKPSPSAEAGDVSALSSLDDPVRRRLYDYVCEQGGPVSPTRPVPRRHRPDAGGIPPGQAGRSGAVDRGIPATGRPRWSRRRTPRQALHPGRPGVRRDGAAAGLRAAHAPPPGVGGAGRQRRGPRGRWGRRRAGGTDRWTRGARERSSDRASRRRQSPPPCAAAGTSRACSQMGTSRCATARSTGRPGPTATSSAGSTCACSRECSRAPETTRTAPPGAAGRKMLRRGAGTRLTAPRGGPPHPLRRPSVGKAVRALASPVMMSP